MQHHGAPEIHARLKAADLGRGVREVVVDLPTDAHTAWDPTSTKSHRRIHGPGGVRYTQFADGGIHAHFLRPRVGAA